MGKIFDSAEEIFDNIPGRMLQFLNNQGVKVTAFETSIGLSRGYLKQSAKHSRDLGSAVVGDFLLSFPKADPYWILLGKKREDGNGQDLPPTKEILEIIRGINIEDRKTISRLHSYIDRLEDENDRLKGEGDKKPVIN